MHTTWVEQMLWSHSEDLPLLVVLDFFFFGHEACRILVPQQGIGPVPPAVEEQGLNHWTTREVLHLVFLLALFSPVLTILILPALRGCLSYIYSF